MPANVLSFPAASHFRQMRQQRAIAALMRLMAGKPLDEAAHDECARFLRAVHDLLLHEPEVSRKIDGATR